MRVLTFSTLYPDCTRPQHGLFVEQRLRQLLALGDVEARVVSPVPWFPSRQPLFGSWAACAGVPAQEHRHGIAVSHPRYVVIPRWGMSVAPMTLAFAAHRALAREISAGFDFDVIDAHYFYPDGVAATWLGRWFDRPVTITARGSDINLIARYRVPRRFIVRAASQAAAVITVSGALREALTSLGVSGQAITVLRNGVDLQQFRPPEDRPALRHALGLSGPTLLAVGNLVPLKGHDLVVSALASLPGVRLVIAGAGPEEARLRRLGESLRLTDRLRFLGRVDQARLPDWYGAADALVLASSSEGLANVLLESMACGTPVIATAVGGNPEVVTTPEAGTLVCARTVEGVVEAARRLLAGLPSREATRRHAEQFSWSGTASALKALLVRVVHEHGAGHSVRR